MGFGLTVTVVKRAIVEGGIYIECTYAVVMWAAGLGHDLPLPILGRELLDCPGSALGRIRLGPVRTKALLPSALAWPSCVLNNALADVSEEQKNSYEIETVRSKK